MTTFLKRDYETMLQAADRLDRESVSYRLPYKADLARRLRLLSERRVYTSKKMT